MTGAEALVQTLLACGVRACFANPGTSEMHLVAALDGAAGLKCVLGLSEGVVTGMADGYARMTGGPGVTLLHLGPGLGNGIANLHNAKKALTPIINIVGDHATYHQSYDAPLSSDVAALAETVSSWVRSSETSLELASDLADAHAASLSRGGATATLIVPADAAWSAGGVAAPPRPPAPFAPIETSKVSEAAALLGNGKRTGILIGGAALQEPLLSMAAGLASRAGARLLRPTSVGRTQSGAGRPRVMRIPYPVVDAVNLLADFEQVILCGAAEPVAFFAYPGKPSLVLPVGCALHTLAGPRDDVVSALRLLDAELGGEPVAIARNQRGEHPPQQGAITAEKIGLSLISLLPDNAVVVDEAITSSHAILPCLEQAAPHDLLQLTGGAIGIGLPLATGAALGDPTRQVVCLQADGSGMYTVQALWTQAREEANIVTIILANHAYATLRGEFANVGVSNPGPNALGMSDLSNPRIDWTALAGSLGVEAHRATTMTEFEEQLSGALRRGGPVLIEANLAP
jgi:acetolactate synthase-1/2/3 large subunit